MKTCSGCQMEGDLVKFYPHTPSTPGVRGYCLDCYKQILRKQRKQNHRNALCTPRGLLNASISRAMALSIRNENYFRKWETSVGYTIGELKKHLGKQFKKYPGMGWSNYGKWHIDHIIPKSVFNYETPDDIDFQRCWSLKNLQPLWKKENLHKHAKTTKPFQPSLRISV